MDWIQLIGIIAAIASIWLKHWFDRNARQSLYRQEKRNAALEAINSQLAYVKPHILGWLRTDPAHVNAEVEYADRKAMLDDFIHAVNAQALYLRESDKDLAIDLRKLNNHLLAIALVSLGMVETAAKLGLDAPTTPAELIKWTNESVIPFMVNIENRFSSILKS